MEWSVFEKFSKVKNETFSKSLSLDDNTIWMEGEGEYLERIENNFKETFVILMSFRLSANHNVLSFKATVFF